LSVHAKVEIRVVTTPFTLNEAVFVDATYVATIVIHNEFCTITAGEDTVASDVPALRMLNTIWLVFNSLAK
jgi:hypothetical protein